MYFTGWVIIKGGWFKPDTVCLHLSQWNDPSGLPTGCWKQNDICSPELVACRRFADIAAIWAASWCNQSSICTSRTMSGRSCAGSIDESDRTVRVVSRTQEQHGDDMSSALFPCRYKRVVQLVIWYRAGVRITKANHRVSSNRLGRSPSKAGNRTRSKHNRQTVQNWLLPGNHLNSCPDQDWLITVGAAVTVRSFPF